MLPAMSQYISVERRGHLLMVGLNRPQKRNAFDVGMFIAIGRAWAELDRDDGLRCGILHAHGEHFTGGLDLAQWAPVFASGKWPAGDEGTLDPLGLSGRTLRKPVVSAVQGICFTIGIELMLATDIRVAARDTRFGQIEIRRGISPVGGATIRMPREIGWGNAMRWLLTGDEFTAEEAHRVGLVQEVVEPGTQLERAVAIAERIAAQAPLGVRATLASSRLAIDDEAAAAARLMPDLKPIMASDDAREGVMSFVERRPARFTGR
jgi:enoyl-CoA hydratase/carnithine racemase